MTAEFWQYDARIGRRWNLDPVVKPWLSSYSTFSNSPISRVDPNGDDDFFDANGKLVRRIRNGTNNIYMSSSTRSGFTLLSDVKVDEQNKKAVASVVQYYAMKVGVTDEKNGLAVGIAGPYDKEKTLAYYDEVTTRIRVVVENGHISEYLNNADNLQNTLWHEFNHHTRLVNNEKDRTSEAYDHLFVYLSQVAHESFEKGTKEYQIQMLVNAASYANEAMTVGDKSILETGPLLRDFNEKLAAQGKGLTIETEMNEITNELEWYVSDGEKNYYPTKNNEDDN